MAADDPRDTKERILDAAEQLFADNGFASTSLRNITAEAGVNLAAVHYYFGSKEALIADVFSRRVAPINRERLEQLDRLESGTESPTVEQIVEAFVEPPIRMAHGWRSGATVTRMLGHAMSQPDVREVFVEQFRDTFERFAAALDKTLPQLSEREILWRFLFMVGSMAYTMTMCDDFSHITGGRCGPHDATATVRRLVPFIASGMKAPLP